MHFTPPRRLQSNPTLWIDQSKINVVNQNKFLGVIFDSILSFKHHIAELKAKGLQSLDLLKVISRLKWGGNSAVLLRIYPKFRHVYLSKH